MNLAYLPSRRAFVGGRFAAVMLALLGVARAAEPMYSDTVIELPKFVVTDSRELPPPESWRYARLPGFEILSNASDRATQRLLNDFQMFRQAMDVVWPMPNDMATPVLLVLCGKGGKFDAFVPERTDAGPEMTRASLCLGGRTRSAIVIDMESRIVNIAALEADDPASGLNSMQFSVEDNKQLYREYVRYLLGRSKPRLPAWFEEGMAQIVMAMQFNPKWIEFGRLHEANTVSSEAAMTAAINALAATDAPTAELSSPLPGAPVEDRDFNAVLARRALIPLEKFFAVPHDSPVAVNVLGNNTWAKQAYAFVHMGLFGERGKWRKPFSEFLLRSTQEPVTEALVKECFGMSYRALAIQLRGYIQAPYYEAQIYRAKDKSSFLTSAPVELRDATPAEVGRIKGQALELAGKTARAKTEFVAPYVRGERDPQLLAALGLNESREGKPDRARKFLEAAVAGRCTDPDAYVELARFRFADAAATPGDANGQFAPEQVASISRLLLTAFTLPPPNPATYELLAETLARSASPLRKQDVAPLVAGVQQFPSRTKLVYAAASLCADAGLPEAAHSLVEHGLKIAPDAATRQLFQRLQASLPPAAPAATPSGSAPAAAK